MGWIKEAGRPLHLLPTPVPISEARAREKRPNQTGVELPSLGEPRPDYQWHYWDPAARPKAPSSTQDLGDNLGLEAF